ncbi:MAG: DNA mismatch repair protein MutS, partial [Bacilli bacterium]|nr:DNA mismatch repair protein MutS [Bacilli bacterium]
MQLDSVDINKVTPMMRHYIETKKENRDIILFYRLGDFYEMFFEDAIIVSRELELTLTGKSAGLDDRIPMCGIPHHASNIYIDKLVSKGYKVGICEQLEDAKNAKGVVKRGIVQIISSGTIMDDSLKSFENNYIGAVLDFDNSYALSYADISTGIIYTSLIEHNQTKLINEIVSIGIKEIVSKKNLDKNIHDILKNNYSITISIVEDIIEIDKYRYIYSGIEDYRLITSIKYLLTYINNTQF